MKLLKYLECERFTRETYAIVPVKARIGLFRDGSWRVTDEDFGPLYRSVFESEELNLSSMACFECEGPLELVEVEQCPHETDPIYWSYYGKTRRQCSLCGENQRGKVSFE